MTLHEYLEQKRRHNILRLNALGACHICESTCAQRSHCRFVNDDDDVGDAMDMMDEDNIDNVGTSAVAMSSSSLTRSVAPSSSSLARSVSSAVTDMCTCQCYEYYQPPTNVEGATKGYARTIGGGDSMEEEDRACTWGGGYKPDGHWPYSLRVCEMCLSDDVTTGRIRCCGICGIVACDEDCGVELVECTDREEWNNAGCLECRGMESFSQMSLFRHDRPHPNGIPRVTRICTKCLQFRTPYLIKCDYICRRLKCNVPLVHSDVVESNRFLTSFPLTMLPEDILDSVFGFMAEKDFCNFALTCRIMYKKMEKRARDLVQRVHHAYPTGPIKEESMEDPRGGEGEKVYKRVFAENRNEYALRAPEDGTTWMGVLYKMEKLTRDLFYFGFQMSDGSNSVGDAGAALRYLMKQDRFTFQRMYAKASAGIVPRFAQHGVSMRGGQVLVPRNVMAEHPLIFSSDMALTTGVHRFICRLFSYCRAGNLGSIGILRRNHGDGSSVTWAHEVTISKGWRSMEKVFGLEYDAVP